MLNVLLHRLQPLALAALLATATLAGCGKKTLELAAPTTYAVASGGPWASAVAANYTAGMFTVAHIHSN